MIPVHYRCRKPVDIGSIIYKFPVGRTHLVVKCDEQKSREKTDVFFLVF
jgi:hypothetical protein